MERRNVIGGALVASLSGLAGADTAEAAAQRDDSSVALAIDNLYKLFDREFDVSPAAVQLVSLVRQQQRTFLRANQKYPDFIDVGIDVWESVYNWHVKHRQPIEASRLGDGRYILTFMFTKLLMRTDLAPDFIGVGY
jgi:hypothetical protein